jgi:hypothetical protein
VNRFSDHLQVVTTNNYNTIAISPLYSSLQHTFYCSQSVTRRFLVTAPTMVIPLPPAQVISSQTPKSQSQSYVTTDGQWASLPWNKAPVWGLRPDFYYCQTIAGFLMWGALSDERTGQSFTMYNVQYIYILRVITWMYIQYIQGLCQSWLSTADHVLSLVASA